MKWTCKYHLTGSPQTIRSQLADSLTRLGTDYIDLYYQVRHSHSHSHSPLCQTDDGWFYFVISGDKKLIIDDVVFYGVIWNCTCFISWNTVLHHKILQDRANCTAQPLILLLILFHMELNQIIIFIYFFSIEWIPLHHSKKRWRVWNRWFNQVI